MGTLTQQEKDSALTRIAKAAVVAEQATGCPAELSVAQCILESNWLQSAPSNNCFGIKDTDRYPGARYSITKEFIDGTWRELKLAFEVYPSLEDCFIDHALLITGGFRVGSRNIYAPAWEQYKSTHDLEAYVRGISVHYATDPRYAAKLFNFIYAPKIVAALAVARNPEVSNGEKA